MSSVNYHEHNEPCHPESLVGALLNQFEIVERLATEGTGTVYKARHRTLSHRVVALKVALDTSSGPLRHHPLEREAKLIHRARHPSVVEVYDLVESNGVRCMVMEYVEGRRLGNILRDTPIDMAHALHYAHRIALALEAIHGSGVGLCNLSDATVVVLHDHSIKVVDFSAAAELESTVPAADNGSVYRIPGESTAHLDVRSFGALLGGMIDRGSPSVDGRLRAHLLDIVRACSDEGSSGTLLDVSGLVAATSRLVHSHLKKRRRALARPAVFGMAAMLLAGASVIAWRVDSCVADHGRSPYVVVRHGAHGCAVEHSVPLKASAYMPAPSPTSILRFYVLRTDEAQWDEPGQLRLFVGDGPTCGLKPHNVTKMTTDVSLGSTVQVIDLDVVRYDGKWSVGEEKVFWVGAGPPGIGANGASNTIVVRKIAEP